MIGFPIKRMTNYTQQQVRNSKARLYFFSLIAAKNLPVTVVQSKKAGNQQTGQ